MEDTRIYPQLRSLLQRALRTPDVFPFTDMDKILLFRIWDYDYVKRIYATRSVDFDKVREALRYLDQFFPTPVEFSRYEAKTVEAQREKAAVAAYRRIYFNMRKYVGKPEFFQVLEGEEDLPAYQWIAVNGTDSFPQLTLLRKLIYKELTGQMRDEDFMQIVEDHNQNARLGLTEGGTTYSDIEYLYAKYRISVRQRDIPAPVSKVPYYQHLIEKTLFWLPKDEKLDQISRGFMDARGNLIDVWEFEIRRNVTMLCSKCNKRADLVNFCIDCSAVFCSFCESGK